MANSPKLQSVLDQAKAASENFTPDESTALVAPNSNTNIVQTSESGRKMSVDDLADNSGMVVDGYLTVKEAGFRSGDGQPYFQTFKARIDLSEVTVISSIRATLNGATQFYKSYDGIMTSTGQSFSQAEGYERNRGAKVDVYQTVEVPALLLEDVPGLDEGKTIGITPAITGVKLWNAFYDKCRKEGLSASAGSVVDVQITCKPQKNKKGNEWGIAEFVLIEEADLS